MSAVYKVPLSAADPGWSDYLDEGCSDCGQRRDKHLLQTHECSGNFPHDEFRDKVENLQAEILLERNVSHVARTERDSIRSDYSMLVKTARETIEQKNVMNRNVRDAVEAFYKTLQDQGFDDNQNISFLIDREAVLLMVEYARKIK